MTRKLVRKFSLMFVGVVVSILIKAFAFEAMASDLPRFLPALGYDSGGTLPIKVVAADLNRDGILDLTVANQCGNNACSVGSIGVLLGYGDGTFRPATNYRSAGKYPSSVAVADLNNDGKPDLIVPNSYSDTVGVLLGKGDGTFRAAVTYSTVASGGSHPTSVAVADVNGDGKPDVVVINYVMVNFLSKTVAVLVGNGDGTLQPPVAYDSGGVIPFSVAITDVNGDRRPDLLVANYHASFQSLNGTVGVLIGNGDGTFQSPVAYPSGAALGPNAGGSIAAADVNGDGKPDLLVANWCSPSTCPNGAVSVLLGNGDGSFRPVVSYASGGSGTYAVAVADVNSDGRADLVVTNEQMWSDVNLDSAVGVLLGTGDGTFQPPVTYNSGGYWPFSVAIGDMNGDGNPDLAVVSDGMPPIFHGEAGVLMNIGGATTATSLVSSLNPSTYGQKVTWTASVATSGPTPPTGTVRLTWRYFTQTYVIGSATLNSDGVVIFTKGNLNAGSYPMSAVYQGDPNSFFGVLRQVVLPTTSAATITSSLNPSTFGQAVTFTAKITSPTVTPSGPVTFTAGTTVLGTAQLSSGKATFTTSTLPAGSTLVQVTYNGNSNIKGSSASVSQTVQP
jgi:hypothetical protein